MINCEIFVGFFIFPIFFTPTQTKQVAEQMVRLLHVAYTARRKYDIMLLVLENCTAFTK